MKILIHTKEETFLNELQEASPLGVTVFDGGERRVVFDDINTSIDISFNIELVIDVAKILPSIVAAWIAKIAASRPRKTYINIRIDGKEMPVNDPDTIKLIEKEINKVSGD